MFLPVRVFPENRFFNFLPFTPCPAVVIFEKIIVIMMHTNKTTTIGNRSLHNFTNIELDTIRENSSGSIAYELWL
jgi:hypothetical protein